jgi:hypothetical protein
MVEQIGRRGEEEQVDSGRGDRQTVVEETGRRGEEGQGDSGKRGQGRQW